MVVLSLIGLALSSYLTAVSVLTLDVSYCEIGSIFSCDDVISSPYAYVFGIPVALVGALGFGLLFVISYIALASENEHPGLLPAAVVLSTVGLAFGAYLTYLELFVIESLCLLCLASFLTILPMVYLSVRDLSQRGVRPPPSAV